VALWLILATARTRAEARSVKVTEHTFRPLDGQICDSRGRPQTSWLADRLGPPSEQPAGGIDLWSKTSVST